jgi:Protein of unknown function (DUF3429)
MMKQEPPFAILVIAASGVVPFALLAAALPLAPASGTRMIVAAMIAYGAVVLGFLGGVRWGAELARQPPAPFRMAMAGLATVPAWASLLVSAHQLLAIALVLAAGLAQLCWDVRAAQTGLLPAWTMALRIGLTAAAAVCLGVAAFFAV